MEILGEVRILIKLEMKKSVLVLRNMNVKDERRESIGVIGKEAVDGESE